MKGKVIVITGGSAGIGAALAQVVSQRGARAVLVARRQAELDAVAKRCGEGTLTVVADVTQRSQVEAAVRTTLERAGGIDVWVNNAGRGISRNPSELTDDDIDSMITVNVKSALYGAQAVLPHFKARGQGHLINVSSVLGRLPFAVQRAAYSASKHFLNALTANLRMELRATHPGIHVSLFSPGVVATDFGLNALHGGVDSRQLPFAQSPEEVAQVIAGLIERPKADVYSRPQFLAQVGAYYSAEDLGDAETKPPFGR
jgi:NADP-dependent 3-hydroxy acid dehydrogenase YdfG